MGWRRTLKRRPTAWIIIGCLAVAWPVCASAETVLSVSEAVEMAVRYNTAIRESSFRMQAVDQERIQARADFFPKAAASYSYTNLEKQPYMEFGGIQRVMVNGREQHHWDISLIQTVFKGFALASRHEASRINVRIAETEHRQLVQDITREVQDACHGVLLAEKMLRVAEQAVESLSAHEADAERFFRHGVIPRNELLKARVARAGAQQEREKANALHQQSRSRLNILVGLPMREPVMIQEPLETEKETVDLEELEKTALRDRPVLAAVRLGLELMDQQIRLAGSDLYPEVSLIGRYEQNGQDFFAQTNDYSNEWNLSVSLQAKWMLFEWGKTRAAVTRRHLERQAFREKVQSVEDRVRLETQQAYLNIGVSRANLHTSRIAVEQAREHFRITEHLYREQVVNSTEVLDARTALTQAETNYFEALYGCLNATADLERAIGRSSNQLAEPLP
jgi:outer membrane protein TolC